MYSYYMYNNKVPFFFWKWLKAYIILIIQLIVMDCSSWYNIDCLSYGSVVVHLFWFLWELWVRNDSLNLWTDSITTHIIQLRKSLLWPFHETTGKIMRFHLHKQKCIFNSGTTPYPLMVASFLFSNNFFYIFFTSKQAVTVIDKNV